MKLGRIILLLASLSPSGCSFYHYGAQNYFSDPFNAMQECAFRNRMRRHAQEAWRTVCKEEGKTYSASYGKGFIEGFVDFVDADGTGEPPAAAPVHERRKLLHSDAGQDHIEDWFAGFRHGAQVARASGLREKAIMPIGLPAKTPSEPLPAQVVVPIHEIEPIRMPPRLLPMQFIAPTLETEPAKSRPTLGAPI